MPSSFGIDQAAVAIESHSDDAAKFAESYEQSGPYRSTFAYSRHRLDAFTARYLPSEANGATLLDVGCGTGHVLSALRERGFTGSGVDGSEAMLKHARRVNPGVEFTQGYVTSLPFEDDSFDWVVCIEVLRYLPRPEGCLREIARVLRPGGHCLVTATPRFNLNGYAVINRLALSVPQRRLTRLRQFFTTSRRLKRQLSSAGFDSVVVHGVYLGPVNWLQRLAPRATPRALRAWEPIDRVLSDRPLFRDVSNMYLGYARHGSA